MFWPPNRKERWEGVQVGDDVISSGYRTIPFIFQQRTPTVTKFPVVWKGIRSKGIETQPSSLGSGQAGD